MGLPYHAAIKDDEPRSFSSYACIFLVYAFFAGGRGKRGLAARVLGPSTSAVASRQLVGLSFDRILDDRLGGVV
jgi:hypothetical protein